MGTTPQPPPLTSRGDQKPGLKMGKKKSGSKKKAASSPSSPSLSSPSPSSNSSGAEPHWLPPPSSGPPSADGQDQRRRNTLLYLRKSGLHDNYDFSVDDSDFPFSVAPPPPPGFRTSCKAAMNSVPVDNSTDNW